MEMDVDVINQLGNNVLRFTFILRLCFVLTKCHVYFIYLLIGIDGGKCVYHRIKSIASLASGKLSHGYTSRDNSSPLGGKVELCCTK
jgi:hypothetical protein